MTDDARLTAVELVAAALRDGSTDMLSARLSGIVLGSYHPEELFDRLRDLVRQYGPLVQVGEARLPEDNEAVVPFRFRNGARNLRIMVDRSGRIVYLQFLPLRDLPAVPTAHRTRLTLPFDRRCLVFWGGTTPMENAHMDADFQRYAVDFVIVDATGRHHAGDGDANEHYHCFAMPVRSAADGEVVDVVSGVRDNMPGYMNRFAALGNAVLVRHLPNEFTLYAHLQDGSIMTEPGRRVQRGETIGRCGNSGNTSEAHLHFQIQHAAMAHDAISIPPVFSDVLVTRDGASRNIAAYPPRRGDLVEPARARPEKAPAAAQADSRWPNGRWPNGR